MVLGIKADCLEAEYKRVKEEWNNLPENKEMKDRYSKQEELIKKVFKKDNTYLQVCLLNHLYSTNLEKVRSGEIIMSEVITKKKQQILDCKYEDTAEEVINDICNEYFEKSNRMAYSFITKYCFHFFEANKKQGNTASNPFIIIDSIVLGQLKLLKKESKPLGKNWSYKSYYKVIEGLQKELKMNYSLRDVELFLWRQGRLEEKQKLNKQNSQINI